MWLCPSPAGPKALGLHDRNRDIMLEEDPILSDNRYVYGNYTYFLWKTSHYIVGRGEIYYRILCDGDFDST